MPVYDFQCRDCGHSFERSMHVDEYERVYEARRDDGASLQCPTCGSERVMLTIAMFEVQTPSKTI
jgi:predicted nucleic acid-binding Zn ribbon protein